MPALNSAGLEPRETGAHPQNEDHHPSRVPKLIGIAQVRPPPVPKCNRSQSPPRRWRKCNMTRLGSPPLNCDASHAASCLTRKRGLNERSASTRRPIRSLTCKSSPSQRGQLPANQTARNELDARTGREQTPRLREAADYPRLPRRPSGLNVRFLKWRWQQVPQPRAPVPVGDAVGSGAPITIST
jgi:hypothetical protein